MAQASLQHSCLCYDWVVVCMEQGVAKEVEVSVAYILHARVQTVSGSVCGFV